ncbi:polar amino acid uptake ABC superfamily ATP binding cassette transporter, amino acid-binding protein [Peptoniphilus sp. ING2-D1G]|nr:polar amino acid uptake ABC superfamily ATP binding cassette transporter, amino acid-binding protein [Peptoniphilus sp. ING2-D1G]
MKKILITCLMLALLLVGCSSDKPEEKSADQPANKNTAETQSAEGTSDVGPVIEKIKSDGYITMGTSAEYPPYEWHDIEGSKDEIIGVDIEIAKAIAEDLGVELKIKDMQFEGLLTALGVGEMDFVIAGMAATDERREAVDFSNPYTSQEQVLLVLTENADKYKSAEDLKGVTIGTQLGSTQETYAREVFEKENGATVNSMPDNNNMVMELKNGTYDVIFMSGIPAEKYADMQEGLSVVDIGAPPEDAYSIAVKKGNTELVEAINKVVDKLIEEDQIKTWEKEFMDLTDK